MTTTRDAIAAALKYYQDSQPNGLKDIDKQLKLYTEDSIFVSFPVAGVVGKNDARVMKGIKEIKIAFDEYNHFIKDIENFTIEYLHTMIDEHNLKGSFVMKITHTTNKIKSIFLNYLQMQFNHDMKVTFSLNWQANADDDEVLKIVES
tara:strand:- start:1655 stop:2098 length:444 start_codon:yes stop_codon:yes gene_type:complete